MDQTKGKKGRGVLRVITSMKLNVISKDYPEHGHIKFLRNIGTFKTYAKGLEFQLLKSEDLKYCKKRTSGEESVKS